MLVMTESLTNGWCLAKYPVSTNTHQIGNQTKPRHVNLVESHLMSVFCALDKPVNIYL